MEALGSPYISRAPTGEGHAFRIPRTSVCRWQVQRQYTTVRLPEIQFTTYLLRVSTLWKAKKKKKKKKKKK